MGQAVRRYPNFCNLPSIHPFPPAEDDPLLPEIPKCDANPLETTVVIPASWLSNTFREILTHRPQVSEFHNFLYGMQLHTDYLQNKQFSMWKGTPTWVLLRGWLCWGEEEIGIEVAIEKDGLLRSR